MKKPRSTILSPESARATGLLLVSLSALTVVTCASAAHGPAIDATAKTIVPPRSAPNKPQDALAGATSATAPAPGLHAVERAARLDRFRGALAAMATGSRREPVRALWLGDSHTAADFWPDAVRKPLQVKFGDGGPGFVYVGLPAYRHAGIKVERSGPWRTEPRRPSLWMRQDDGVFGLGGIRAVPEGASSRATVVLSADAVRRAAHWDLAFRLPTDKARFSVATNGEVRAVDAKTYPVGTIAHVEWETPTGGTMTIESAAGEPQILGAIVESAEPGVVVDTLGINGARIGTPLAWEADPWIEAARRRRASLVVIAYGTNEVGDQVAASRYGPELETLVERVRQAAPDADCLVVGPTDRESPEWTTLPRVAEIDSVEREAAGRAGCAFVSAFDAMGGDGGLKRWAEQTPPLAGSDHVHLTPRGYAELGAPILSALLPDDAPPR